MRRPCQQSSSLQRMCRILAAGLGCGALLRTCFTLHARGLHGRSSWSDQINQGLLDASDVSKPEPYSSPISRGLIAGTGRSERTAASTSCTPGKPAEYGVCDCCHAVQAVLGCPPGVSTAPSTEGGPTSTCTSARSGQLCGLLVAYVSHVGRSESRWRILSGSAGRAHHQP